MSLKDYEASFLEYVRKMLNIEEAIGVLYWDLRTGAPKNAVIQRSNVIGQLSADVFKMSTSKDMAHYLITMEEAISAGKCSLEVEKTVKYLRKQYDQNTKIPVDEFEAFVKCQAISESVWAEAKEENNFAKFEPYLTEIIEYKRKFVEYLGYKDCKYDTYLDQYEPGMTVNKLDEVFSEVRNKLVPIVKAVSTSGKNFEKEEMKAFVSTQKQKDICEQLLASLGYNFDAGRLDPTPHPFATSLNLGDVRVTTKYHENNFEKAIFSTIHECGHALYEQNISKDLEGLPIAQGASLGIHESQSLLYEKIIGQSYEFWKSNYPKLKEQLNGVLDNVSLDEFYKLINNSKPSFIRIEADELTYPLHVMIRYEIEKDLLDGKIQVSELPSIWNKKMEEYLGIIPETDREGVLQDVHWSMGHFGYFPTYALGAMYAAQIKATMEKELTNFSELVETNDFQTILDWLKVNIHQYGAMKEPQQILKDVTGEELNVKYFVEYLESKYTILYELEEVNKS
ncbi:carboxypeptidase M32 [Bacillus sp. AFS053548]|uniref:carboxypeptidase M32 n=1 Tax=Bacillus sp. AFS053548 TaxID=2033505 RepID=UPI000BFB630B|nr:carboxypeptidase M32 [Bacillus sp. AFS053548]PGM49237.1 carboxypeptidase M32 [Bacillus sp. AFS053548]